MVPENKKARAEIVLSPTQAVSSMDWQPVEAIPSPAVTYQPVQFTVPVVSQPPVEAAPKLATPVVPSEAAIVFAKQPTVPTRYDLHHPLMVVCNLPHAKCSNRPCIICNYMFVNC